jgi:putative transposase
VSSGLSGHRATLMALGRDAIVGPIKVEQRDRLARFGVEYLEAVLAAQGRRLVVASMLVHQAFRFELDPSNTVASELASSAGAARFAYNWGLALVKARLDERARVAELLGVEGLSRREARALAGSTVEVPWSLTALRREWNRAKDAVAPWWAANSKECYSSGLDALARGLKAYSGSKNSRRQGPKVGFPKFKKRGAQRKWRITTGSFGIADDHHVRLPRIGVVRTNTATRQRVAPRPVLIGSGR